MHVLFDHQIFSMQRLGGVSRYFFELMSGLRREGIEVSHGVKLTNNRYVSGPKNRNLDGILGGMEFIGRRRLQKAINGRRSKSLITGGDFDVFHPTYYNPYFIPLLCKKPYVITVYDMIHTIFPSMFRRAEYLRTWLDRCVEGASAIIAISESTRKDFLETYPLVENRVHVVYLASSFQQTEIVNAIGVSSNPYFLFVGGRAAYKNFDRCLIAFAMVARKLGNLTLVAAGATGLTRSELRQVHQLGLDGKVDAVLVGDEQLGSLYRNALALIYPSIYEGFGLPIVEAFSVGCPVATSNTSAMLEIAGNAALYFDPWNHESMAEVLMKIAEDDGLRRSLVEKSLTRGSFFSWEKTVKETISVYARVASVHA